MGERILKATIVLAIAGEAFHCSVERGDYRHSCGPEGKFFVPVRSLEAGQIDELERMLTR